MGIIKILIQFIVAWAIVAPFFGLFRGMEPKDFFRFEHNAALCILIAVMLVLFMHFFFM